MVELLENEEKFGKVSSWLYSYFGEIYPMNLLHQFAINDITKHMKNKNLDIGCGPGNIDIKLGVSNPDYYFYGIDPSPYMIYHAKKKAEKKKLKNVLFAEGSSRIIPFKEKFDFAFSVLSLHHWDGLEDSFRVISEYLKDNGLFIAYEFNIDYFKNMPKVLKIHLVDPQKIEKYNSKYFSLSYEVERKFIKMVFKKVK
ncbi:MAG: class I SAM-dependent methyltransferase [Thermoplasmata archaeon]